ncbi:DNA cytosine methyltransferase [Acetobacteraceae bacterium KSS8]|uniref:Cytosine-specific methyltransferase n=1 Tax=Endosaccharibacter trunci TaxID=2812733 RepID=A0ABT1W3H5_9PROT|nr:DNA cytosine methyltransferase [Acetobacteraceae bacterium KSS8]
MKVVDLFCGCGGFSLGAHGAGFDVVSAYDIDPNLTYSFSRNFPKTNLYLEDIASLTGERILAAANGVVDGVFGGPPCQGFSDIGHRAADDPRRQLLRHFFRLVAEVEPTFFVMENVRGLSYSGSRHLLDAALALVADRYALLGPHVWDAAEFGAATRRQRLFVVGIHKDRGDALTLEDVDMRKVPATTVKSAIADLQRAIRLENRDGYDRWRLTRPGRPSAYATRMRDGSGVFTGHLKSVHAAAVVERFAALGPGLTDPIGRHPKLDWQGQCPTLRAGTGADRGSFQSVRPIHPSEARVITVREAARLQGFPDSHRFHPTVWHSFRMIGNSVSPFVATKIFEAVATRLSMAAPYAIAAE